MNKDKKASASAAGQNYPQFIGKTFQLSKHTVSIEDVIAEGGFSIVFLVRSSSSGKKYALKRMYVNNEYDLDACKREIQIIKSLSEHNKNILKYVDSSIQRQTSDIYEILLLTKYCKLGGLVQLMNDRLNSSAGRLNESEILHIFCDTCEALSDLHANGIIHRDLKIENILIEDASSSSSAVSSSTKHPFNYTFVLCDFGSATKQIFDRRQNLNMSHQTVQLVADEIQKYTTPAYRSPEMVDLYSNKPITTKSDIWALGCLLYKLCYFQMPFGESLLAIQEGRYTIPDQKANYYSRQLNCLINYMLDTDPIKRPDIFQVSFLAFSLAQRQCNIKNINSSEIPNINNLNPPLTESEWKKTAFTVNSSNQMKKTVHNNLDSTNTTVNPRERPKGNISTINPIVPLVNKDLNTNNVNKHSLIQQQQQSQRQGVAQTNKINLSIKPSVNLSAQAFSSSTQQPPQTSSSHQEEQFGFDDDFGTINSTETEQLASLISQTSNLTTNNNNVIQPSATVSNLPTSPSFPNHQQYIQQQIQPQQSPINPVEKKSHRRSASHNFLSSTGFMQPNMQLMGVNPQLAGIDNTITSAYAPRLTPTQIQQQQYQYDQYKYQYQQQQQQLLLQQQQLQYQQQQQQQQIQQTPLSSSNSRYLQTIPNHSRSASASPNAATKTVPPQVQKQDTTQNAQKPPLNQPNEPKNTNPFDDSFSQLNDNEIFGLEFDKIRHKNEQQFLMNQQLLHHQQQQQQMLLYQQQQQLQLQYQQQLQQQLGNNGIPKLNTINQAQTFNKPENSKKKSCKKEQKQKKDIKKGGISGAPLKASSSSSSIASTSSSSSLYELKEKLQLSTSSIKSSRSSSCTSESRNFSIDNSELESSQKKLVTSSLINTSSDTGADQNSQNLDESETKLSRKKNKIKYVNLSDNINSALVMDPFRKAPFKIISKSGSSSSSSNSSLSSASASSIKQQHFYDFQQHSTLKKPTGIYVAATDGNSSEQSKNFNTSTLSSGIGSGSAFQPYIRPPDPFVSAPFELPTNSTGNSSNHRKVSVSSSSSSITPTASTASIYKEKRSKSKSKKDTKRDKSGHSSSSTIKTNDLISTGENLIENQEIIEVIGDKIKNIKTPVSTSKAKRGSSSNNGGNLRNPFIDAPFTGKKSKAVVSVVNKSNISTSNSSNYLSNVNTTPKSTTTSKSSELISINNAFNENDKTPTPTSNSAFIAKLNKTNQSTLVAVPNNNSNKIPQSQSLNEIKPNENPKVADLCSIASGGTSKLIKQYQQSVASSSSSSASSSTSSSSSKMNKSAEIDQLDRAQVQKSYKILKNKPDKLNSINNTSSSATSTGSTMNQTSNSGGISNMSFDDY